MFGFVAGVACGLVAARYFHKYGFSKLPPKVQAVLVGLNAKVW